MLLRSATFYLLYVRNPRHMQIVQMKAETACRFYTNKYFYINYSMLERVMEIASCNSLISLAPGEQIIKTVSSSCTQTADIALLIILFIFVFCVWIFCRKVYSFEYVRECVSNLIRKKKVSLAGPVTKPR
jgi:hypothetical protein